MKTFSMLVVLASTSLAPACGSDPGSSAALPSTSAGPSATTVPTPVGSSSIKLPPTTVDAHGDAAVWELEAIRDNLSAANVSEEAFSFQNLKELRKRSSISVVATIERIEPGPAEIMAMLADGQVIVNETLAITLEDNEGDRHQLIQDYGEAVGFDTVASDFPIGSTAVLFGVPYTLPENRRTPDEFDRSDSDIWQLAHPLAFLVLSKENVLVPIFSEYNSARKASMNDDVDYLRTIGLEVAEIRWPEVAHG